MIAIISAMEKEIEGLKNSLTDTTLVRKASLTFLLGKYKKEGASPATNQRGEIDVVAVESGIGKVSASVATAMVIELFKPSLVVNIGVSGGISKNAGLLDVVVAQRVVQHDFDLTAFGYERGFVPALKSVFIDTDKHYSDKLMDASNCVRANGVFRGIIASGDRFIHKSEDISFLKKSFGADACDMESAGIGQACKTLNVPFCVLRTVSDTGNELEYEQFSDSASKQSIDIIKHFFELI